MSRDNNTLFSRPVVAKLQYIPPNGELKSRLLRPRPVPTSDVPENIPPLLSRKYCIVDETVADADGNGDCSRMLVSRNVNNDGIGSIGRSMLVAGEEWLFDMPNLRIAFKQKTIIK